MLIHGRARRWPIILQLPFEPLLEGVGQSSPDGVSDTCEQQKTGQVGSRVSGGFQVVRFPDLLPCQSGNLTGVEGSRESDSPNEMTTQHTKSSIGNLTRTWDTIEMRICTIRRS